MTIKSSRELELMRQAGQVVAQVKADLMEAMGTTEAQELGAALFADESNFIDHSRSSAFLVREVEL